MPFNEDRDLFREAYFDLPEEIQAAFLDRGDEEWQCPELELLDSNGRIVIFTDGSRKGPSVYPWLQRAGTGVWWGHQHPAICALPRGGLILPTNVLSY